MVKAYNANIENGIKAALFGLEEMVRDNKVKDGQIDLILDMLGLQVVRAQNAQIDNVNPD